MDGLIIELFPGGESPACCITRLRLTNARHPTNPANEANGAGKHFSGVIAGELVLPPKVRVGGWEEDLAGLLMSS